MICIEAHRLTKRYGPTVALAGVDLRVETGRIVGLIGRNGAGKTTALNAILGLMSFEGDLRVLERDPWRERDRLMQEVCFMADVAVLPRWITPRQLLDYLAGVHPRFDRGKAEGFLAKSAIPQERKVKDLSKGLVTQLHLALVMAIDARLLVLDEPTLGLDLIFRKQFYDSLLTDYYDRDRTIVLATHQVDEVEHVLSDVVFVEGGRVILAASVEGLEARFQEVLVHPEQVAAARALRPIDERQVLGGTLLLFDGGDPRQLAALGQVRRPSIADLFVALVGAGKATAGAVS